MAQERTEHETIHHIVVQSLKKELGLAVAALLQVKEARETLAIESQVVDSAQSAFQHATEALDRIPQLAPDDMKTVQGLMDEFRSAMVDLER